MKIFKNDFWSNNWLVILSYIFLVCIISYCVHNKEKIMHKNNFISIEEKIVARTYSKENYLNDTCLNQSIKIKKLGYTYRGDKSKISESKEIHYYVVFSNGDTSIISEEKFKYIKKGDKIIFKTIIIQLNDEK